MINDASTITLYFSLALENGDIVDSNFGKKAATFAMGDGSLLPGFEKHLIGLSQGDKQTFIIEPKDGFGAHNPMNVQQFKRSTFDEDSLQENMIVSFIDAGQHEIPGVIQSFDDEDVTVDFNHPLAGKNIVFTVEIVNVQ